MPLSSKEICGHGISEFQETARCFLMNRKEEAVSHLVAGTTYFDCLRFEEKAEYLKDLQDSGGVFSSKKLYDRGHWILWERLTKDELRWLVDYLLPSQFLGLGRQ